MGAVPDRWRPLPLGEAQIVRNGADVTIVSLGVGLHRSLQAAGELVQSGLSAEIIDLRTVSPLDTRTVNTSIARTKRLLVVDEDYQGFGLSGELAAQLLESGQKFIYGRVCTQTTIPYARAMEDQVLPNVERIVQAAQGLVSTPVE